MFAIRGARGADSLYTLRPSFIVPVRTFVRTLPHPWDKDGPEERQDRTDEPKPSAECVNEDPPKHTPCRYKHTLYRYLLHGFPPSVRTTLSVRLLFIASEHKLFLVRVIVTEPIDRDVEQRCDAPKIQH